MLFEWFYIMNYLETILPAFSHIKKWPCNYAKPFFKYENSHSLYFDYQ